MCDDTLCTNAAIYIAIITRMTFHLYNCVLACATLVCCIPLLIFVPKMHDLDLLQLAMETFILSNIYSMFRDVH